MISARFGKRVLELSREEIKKATPDWVAFFCCSAEFSGGVAARRRLEDVPLENAAEQGVIF
jgi:hypothetical protein